MNDLIILIKTEGKKGVKMLKKMEDNDGNAYPTVKIGNQVWVAENLRTTEYRNGDPITKVTDAAEWTALETEGCCAYNNNEENVETYGYLYNWYAATDGRNIAPTGWHVPTDAEWQTLVDYLGGRAVAGGKLKSTSGWSTPNAGATNESNFSALPGGYRNDDGGGFGGLAYYAYFWSASESGLMTAWLRNLFYSYANIGRSYGFNYKNCGFSVRLIKN